MPTDSSARTFSHADYSLVGKNTAWAIEHGLAEASWYTPPVAKDKMRALLQRRDGPAIRDTLIWFALIISSGVASYLLWQADSYWAIFTFLIYGALYASSSDSRWHETSHGTAFKTDWMNNALYEIASFMVLREASIWRWSHTRHHSDTIVVGRDPEIAIPRPTHVTMFFLAFFGIGAIRTYFKQSFLHLAGQLSASEKTFIPESEYGGVYLRARICLSIYLGVIALALYQQSLLPLMFIGLPVLFGSWLMPIYGHTQHAGLAENVLDHRQNCRTVHMNLVNRYLYWNMNYHVEHHMFPLVPYHNLPKLHELIKADLPTPYRSIWHAWCELLPAVLRQAKEPTYFVKRELPTPRSIATSSSVPHTFTAKGRPVDGWLEVCASHFLKTEDVLRFDHAQKTYAIYRINQGELYASAGMCTHGETHLAGGLVKGNLIECPKHNGRFDVTDGSPQRSPVCIALKTYRVREHDDKIFIALDTLNTSENAALPRYQFRVRHNENLTAFIKELVLDVEPGTPRPNYQPGQYLQIEIPAYEDIALGDLAPPYADLWQQHNISELHAQNPTPTRRNYSFASNPASDQELRFNVRLALPPRDEELPPGIGSSYVHNLKTGDKLSATGPVGDFLLKPGLAEMVYLGGGAGMAPLRSHLAYLFDTLQTDRRVSFWYGARTSEDIFYRDYFETLAEKHPNFSFHLALSNMPESIAENTLPIGYIHEVLYHSYLATHPNPAALEYYLCGPPLMLRAAQEMLKNLAVPEQQIAYDEF